MNNIDLIATFAEPKRGELANYAFLETSPKPDRGLDNIARLVDGFMDSIGFRKI